MVDDQLKQVRRVALNMLARREHSAGEIGDKLSLKGFAPGIIGRVVEALVAERLVNDERFCEAYLRSRRHKGFGPMRIREELRAKGVEASLVAQVFGLQADEWGRRAVRAREKRFGEGLPPSLAEKAKQQRFLHYRGFTAEQIRYTFEVEASILR